MELDKCKTFDEALSKFTDSLVKNKIVKTANIEKIDEEDRYVFRVEGCIWSGRVHKQLNDPKDVTCPFALAAMAMYRKFKGQIANETQSEYFYNGTETVIEPATF